MIDSSVFKDRSLLEKNGIDRWCHVFTKKSDHIAPTNVDEKAVFALALKIVNEFGRRVPIADPNAEGSKRRFEMCFKEFDASLWVRQCINRSTERPYIKSSVCGIFVYEAKSSSEIPEEVRFSNAEGHTTRKLYRDRYFNQIYLDTINHLTPAVQNQALSLVETALRWLMHHSTLRPFDGDGIIIGANSVEQLGSNLNDLQKGPLPDEVVRALDEA
ncbi:unnamed protein product [Didymodactylos carnosus]|uniref:NADP-dependent oxidoreductase domain-containing protein n=1 Tax=Didymodactylos carnosus TaxID=1234261 RepID=A0A814E9I9_9BILA|nr:unnamed protein product [Didymodactylos carnosus]CAF3739365.1 unnamed protein product [Didymodactylos carnosus]